MKPTHSIRFKRLTKILKNFGLLWQALKKFNEDNGFFLSSGITFNILINLIPFILLLLALVGTYLYNDQEVLEHIRAYFRDVAPALDPKVMENLMDVMQSRRIVGISGICRFALVLNMGFRLPEDCSQHCVPGGEEQGSVAWNRH